MMMFILGILAGLLVGFCLAVGAGIITARLPIKPERPRFAAIGSGDVVDLGGDPDPFRGGVFNPPRGFCAPQGIA